MKYLLILVVSCIGYVQASYAETLLVVNFSGNEHYITKVVELDSAHTSTALSANKREKAASILAANDNRQVKLSGSASGKPFTLALPDMRTVRAPMADGQGHTQVTLSEGSYLVRIPQYNVALHSLELSLPSDKSSANKNAQTNVILLKQAQ